MLVEEKGRGKGKIEGKEKRERVLGVGGLEF